MNLHFRELGKGEAIIILHGLYGSGENWLSIGKALCDKKRIILADCRNHGLSPHSPSHTFEDSCEDIKQLLDNLNIAKTSIIGHSMGGKTAMYFANKYPQMLDKLVIVDIAPKCYLTEQYSKNNKEHKEVIRIFEDINLEELHSYTEVLSYLDKYSLDDKTKQIFAKNIKRNENKEFQWKLNIQAIKKGMENMYKSCLNDNDLYNKDTYFIKGETSNYLLESDKENILIHFPNAHFYTINGSGHSPHRDKAEDLINLLKNIL